MEEDDFVNISLKLYHTGLHYHMFLVVILPELRGVAIFFLFEDAVEIAQVIESAVETNFWNAPACIDEHSRSSAQPDVDNVVGEVAPGV